MSNLMIQNNLQRYILPHYLEKKFLQSLKKEFSLRKPFPHLSLRDFFNRSPLRKVAAALREEEFKEQDTDLYQFLQTKQDIKATTQEHLRQFYAFLSSKEFLDYITSLTGITVASIDMSGFIYRVGDYLLCHDDRLSGRKIAYVVNLSTMNPRTGGDLALMIHKGAHPDKIVERIYPEFGMLNIFEVSPQSWHQVEEVLDKERVTLTGWFHG